MTLSLVAFDTDQIKSYVFATSRLVEIRGASALLDILNRDTMAECAGRQNAIFANGGGGLVLAPTEDADRIIGLIQQRYREATENASVTGVQVQLPQGFTRSSDLREHWRLLELAMRAAKERGPRAAPLVAHPLIRPCDSCGVAPALRITAEAGAQEPSLICRSCAAKRQIDNEIKVTIPLIISGAQAPTTHVLWQRLVGELRDAGYPFGSLQRPRDFGQLGEASSPSGYIGLIYADGDDMGRSLAKIASLEQMAAFAHAVDEAIYGATRKAILAHLRPRPQAPSLPFDILLLGGDDLVMATTADTAIQVALTAIEEFGAQTRAQLGQPLSLSVAVILAHTSFPIRSLIDLAGTALKFSKKERVLRGLSQGLLNFLVVSSASHLDFEAYHQSTLTAEEALLKTYRTLRPYTAADMHKLLAGRRALGDAAHTKIEQLRSAVFKTRTQAMLDGRVALLRWGNKDHARQIERFLQQMADGTETAFPWFRRGDAYYTPLLDLAELFDFTS